MVEVQILSPEVLRRGNERKAMGGPRGEDKAREGVEHIGKENGGGGAYMIINEIMLLTNWLLDYPKKVFDFNIGKNL